MSITVIDIISAISNTIRSMGYPLKDVDITKEIPRPCLVVEADNITDNKTATGLAGEQISLSVYYFAQRREKGYLELLKCQKDIKAHLSKPLKITAGFYVTIDDMEFIVNKSDMSLIATFEIYTAQDIPGYDDFIAPDSEQWHDGSETEIIEELDMRLE